MPFALQVKVDALVCDMLDQGGVVPSKSTWVSLVALVRKQNEKMHFCVDYIKLNLVTKLDEFPLPCIVDMLDTLGGSQYFTALNPTSGYWQGKMELQSLEKSTFTTYSEFFNVGRSRSD